MPFPTMNPPLPPEYLPGDVTFLSGYSAFIIKILANILKDPCRRTNLLCGISIITRFPKFSGSALRSIPALEIISLY